MRDRVFTKLTGVLLLAGCTILAQTSAKQSTASSKVNADGARVIPSVAAIEKRTPPLPPFKPQQPTRIQLSNGMVIFLQEDHELPFIEGVARVRGGTREGPAEKTGMLGIYGDVWRTGGTKSKTGDELDDFLEARAAQVETGSGLDSTTISFSSLKQDYGDVFLIFLDLLRDPQFREDKIELAKQQSMTAISRRNEEANAIANREARKIGYGPNSPYSRQAEYWTVGAVNRQDLFDWHKKYVHPNNIIFGVVGDFDAKQMEAQLRQAFESWPKGPQAEKVKTSFTAPRPGVFYIEKDDVNQSSIQMVTLGTTRDNPDFYAITVMNEAIGGGFSSRFVKKIRTQLGLAYSVGGGIGANFDHPGLFRIVMGTKSEGTAAAIDELYKEIDNLKKMPFTAEEIALAKANILNSFIFNFDTKDEVLREKMAYEFYGYPPDTLEKFRVGIEKTTVAGVNKVTDKYVDRGKFAVLVVGKAKDFDRPLASYGKVEVIDIVIPTQPPGAKTAKTGSPGTSE